MIDAAEMARFVAKFRSTEGCWNWFGATDRNGYGRFYRADRLLTRAHRVAYEIFVGPIPEGLVLDHLCQNKRCVNPVHLEPVTIAENVRRYFRLKTHCPNGHEYTQESVRIIKGVRICKKCNVLRVREYKARKAAGVAA